MAKTEIDIRKRTPETEWSGYTLDELRYQRALTTARIEISKELLMMQATQLYKGKLPPHPNKSGMFSRMFSALNMFDYAILAIRIGHKLTGMFRSFKR